MKILIADDDPQILRALRITLSARGYQIITAHNGTGAVNAATGLARNGSPRTRGRPRLGLDDEF
ncbi:MULTISPECIES: hypothetical protein [unclassified Plantibacter]|uniref:hypothetical protein n=1 Tax=unclassified Plantibacter TaxID=2624265 RepID=UPI0039C923E3